MLPQSLLPPRLRGSSLENAMMELILESAKREGVDKVDAVSSQKIKKPSASSRDSASRKWGGREMASSEKMENTTTSS